MSIRILPLPPNPLFLIAFFAKYPLPKRPSAWHNRPHRDRPSPRRRHYYPAYHGTDPLRQIVELARRPHRRRRYDLALHRPSTAARSHEPAGVRRPEAPSPSAVAREREPRPVGP